MIEILHPERVRDAGQPPHGPQTHSDRVDGGRLIGHQVSWVIPVLESGEKVRHTITFRVADDATGHVQLTGFAAVPSGDPNSGNNENTITIALGPGM